MTKQLALFTLASLAVAACDTERHPTDPGAVGLNASLETADSDTPLAGPGAVYTITNEATGNAVVQFPRTADGSLGAPGTFPTGGTGTGQGLGSQGAVILSGDGRWLLAVNAGSNDVSVFRVGPQALSLTSRTPSGGVQPISVTISGSVVYVLNAGRTGNISGFTLDQVGGLNPIPGAIRGLSGDDVQPAQVSFSPDGRQVVVTEKGTNLIDVFPVDRAGVVGQRSSFVSAGGTPFGFAFGPRNLLFVSEAAGAGSASSYRLAASGLAQLISPTVATNQGAPCWAVVTQDGRFGYTGNGANSVSGFTIAPDGTLQLLDADGATAVLDGGVNDIALSRNSQFLYVLQVGPAPAVHAYRIAEDGHLLALGSVGGLPASTRGLIGQ